MDMAAIDLNKFQFSVGTLNIAAEKGGMYVVYVGAFLVRHELI